MDTNICWENELQEKNIQCHDLIAEGIYENIY